MPHAHTPGPWTVEPWTYENGNRTVLTIQTTKDAVAQVLDLWCPDDRKDEAQANARLIAAAPAGLALAQLIVQMEQDGERIDTSIVHAAYNLITRATGRERG